ncbi:hypothetical protein TDIS_2135 [Thermosulfurimonas dismutans]|uniref:Uncharacterized protein n=1 Tax=Thermosulfurimonas dismutans TaxID=999894 RepID=A0A179D1A2_9BACT|nr:hypothetical protein TDIS_2135 [Thermosulfurimonas dismutans]
METNLILHERIYSRTGFEPTYKEWKPALDGHPSDNSFLFRAYL